jgi:hypothetical protein
MMSVARYLGKNAKAPRNLRDQLKDDMKNESKDNFGKDTKQESLKLMRETAAYQSVDDYDPVLRAHSGYEEAA